MIVDVVRNVHLMNSLAPSYSAHCFDHMSSAGAQNKKGSRSKIAAYQRLSIIPTCNPWGPHARTNIYNDVIVWDKVIIMMITSFYSGDPLVFHRFRNAWGGCHCQQPAILGIAIGTTYQRGTLKCYTVA